VRPNREGHDNGCLRRRLGLKCPQIPGRRLGDQVDSRFRLEPGPAAHPTATPGEAGPHRQVRCAGTTGTTARKLAPRCGLCRQLSDQLSKGGHSHARYPSEVESRPGASGVLSSSSSASSQSNPMCSVHRNPRRHECTICSTVGPAPVRTVRVTCSPTARFSAPYFTTASHELAGQRDAGRDPRRQNSSACAILFRWHTYTSVAAGSAAIHSIGAYPAARANCRHGVCSRRVCHVAA
jgi:hypothetical protein